jgi:hypothetical protein
MASASNSESWHRQALDGRLALGEPGGFSSSDRLFPVDYRLNFASFQEKGTPAMSFKVFSIRLHKWAAREAQVVANANRESRLE